MRILIVDDHALVCDGLAFHLRGLSPREVVYAGSVAGALAQLQQGSFGLIFLDYFLPDLDPEDPMGDVLAAAGATPVIVLSGDEDSQRARRLLAAGARGYIPKSSPPEVMLAAVELVRRGGTYLPPFLLSDSRAQLGALGLTARQLEVLRLIALGQSNKEIAEALSTSESTARAHVSAIFKVLGVDNRTQAAQIAHSRHLV